MNKVCILILVLLTVGIHSEIINSYFSQDDFFHLRVIMDKDLGDIPSFFISLQTEYAFYRPFSRETFNLIMYKLFGLNALPFHIVNLVLITANIGLLFYFVKKLTNKLSTSFLSALIYSSSAIHSVELYYLASVQTLFATMFLLLSLLSYLSILKNYSLRGYLASITLFIFALFSHETAMVYPGILFFVMIFVGAKRGVKMLHKGQLLLLLPFFILLGIYLFGTGIFTNLPQQQVYRPVYNIKSIINTLSWYSIWGLGFSEILVDFIGPKFTINPNLIRWYGDYLKIVSSLFGFFVLSILFFIIQYRSKILDLKLLFYVFAYIATLAPFLLFPQHKSIYYLSFAIVWLSAMLGSILSLGMVSGRLTKIWTVILVMAFIVINFQTTQLNRLTYWAAKRAKAAEYLINDLKNNYPNPQKGTVFYIKNDPEYPFIANEWGGSSKQAFYILSGPDAFRLLFRDSTIQVYFEDMDKPPALIDKKIIQVYTAKFPY